MKKENVYKLIKILERMYRFAVLADDRLKAIFIRDEIQIWQHFIKELKN